MDIVVGTPGRLDDLVSTGKLTLSQVRFLVLDEAVSIKHFLKQSINTYVHISALVIIPLIL